MQGIKFNQDGITAILENRKTMTRRPIKQAVRSISDDGHIRVGHGLIHHGTVEHFINECSKYKIGETVFVQEEFCLYQEQLSYKKQDGRLISEIQDGSTWFKEYGIDDIEHVKQHILCMSDGCIENVFVDEDRWKTASEMTEKEARIFLKITNIKVERLQDISEEDCLKEGGEVACMSCDELYPNCKCTSPDYDNYKDVFRYDIWNKLPYQAPYDWNSNPYVFVYEFEVVK